MFDFFDCLKKSPLRWVVCGCGVAVSAENPAEKPSSLVFPDFSRGQVLWEGCRILNGLEGP